MMMVITILYRRETGALASRLYGASVVWSETVTNIVYEGTQQARHAC